VAVEGARNRESKIPRSGGNSRSDVRHFCEHASRQDAALEIIEQVGELSFAHDK